MSTALAALPTSAEAGWLSCPGTATTTDQEFRLQTGPTATCYQSGTGNISGSGDTINNLGWITLDTSSDGTTGALEGSLQISGQGTTTGGFTINPLAWATYSQLAVAFQSPSGGQSPDWAAFILPINVTSGSWRITGDEALSRANLYGKVSGATQSQQPAMPEPTTLALFGTGLGLFAWAARKRRIVRAATPRCDRES